MKRKHLVWLLLFVLVLTSACSTYEQPAPAPETQETPTATGEPTPGAQAKQVLTYSVVTDMPTLDNTLTNSVPSMTVVSHLQEGLVRLHNGKVQPGLAEDWKVSDDGLVYTFTLRDAKWSDGKAISANDFVYALQRLVDPATASPYSFIAEPVKNSMKITAGEMPVTDLGVKAVDEKTLEITVEQPTPYFLGMLNMPHYYPARQDFIEQYGKEYSADADKLLYCGPFVLKEWRHEDRLILEKNPNYWDADKVKLDEVNILVVSDPKTALAMYENGELDFVDVPSDVVKDYPDVQTYYDGADDFLKLNMAEGQLLANKNLRLALNYAINRQDYIDITTGGVFDAGTRYVLPVVSGVDKKYGEEYPLEAFPKTGDATLAKEYLDKALTELNLTSPDQIEIEFLTTDTDNSRIQAEVLQDQMQRNLGIKINIRQVPYKQRLEMESKREFQMVFTGWAPDYDDPYTYLGLFLSDGSYNHGQYNNPNYDKLIHDSVVEKDPKTRMTLLADAEKLLLEDAAIVPLQMRRVAWLKNPKLEGLVKSYVGPREDYIYASFSE